MCYHPSSQHQLLIENHRVTVYLKQETLQIEFIYQIHLQRLLNLAYEGGIKMMKVFKKAETSFKKARIFN